MQKTYLYMFSTRAICPYLVVDTSAAFPCLAIPFQCTDHTETLLKQDPV